MTYQGSSSLPTKLKLRSTRWKKRSWKKYKECFIAGGGSLSTYYRIRKIAEEKREVNTKIILDQVKSGSYYAGPRPMGFFCFTGFVPELK